MRSVIKIQNGSGQREKMLAILEYVFFRIILEYVFVRYREKISLQETVAESGWLT